MLQTIHNNLEEQLINCKHNISAMQQQVSIVDASHAYIASVSIKK